MNKKIILIIIVALPIIYFSSNYYAGKGNFSFVGKILNKEQISIIEKYIFPYKLISKQRKEILQHKSTILLQQGRMESIYELPLVKLELDFKESLNDIRIEKTEDIKLSNNTIMNKYKLVDGFYSGIYFKYPGSGYIDFHQDNLLVLSSRGILGYNKNIKNELHFKAIKNNINDFISLKQFSKHRWFSLKDLLIHENKIYISYTEEVKENCWNTSVIYGNINYANTKFKKLFSSKECVHSKNNIDKEFNAHQSGGRMVNFDNNHILLSVGEYRSRFLAQKKDNINGKIIKINIKTSDYEIISMGHRNPQGLYYDKKNNFIIEAEHGPMGGDEVNLIEIDKIDRDEPLNYGWPIVSAGKHYNHGNNEEKYKKYPLYKSHSKYGFMEPLKSFVPSIGISEITKIGENSYVAGSLRAYSLYFFELNSEKKMINLKRVKTPERIRDMKFKNNKLYLFLENTAQIGIISLN